VDDETLHDRQQNRNEQKTDGPHKALIHPLLYVRESLANLDETLIDPRKSGVNLHLQGAESLFDRTEAVVDLLVSALEVSHTGF
jgi:hypothetical protein